MKRLNRVLPVLSAVVILSLSQIKATQADTKTTEPEYIGVFVALDHSNGALIEPERHTTTPYTRLKALGFAGGDGYLEVPGERSPTRFKVNALPPFLVKVASQQADPQSETTIGPSLYQS